MSTTAIWPRTGRTAPAGSPCPSTSRLQLPAASTTAPASIRPPAWSTPVARPPSVRIRRTSPVTNVAPARERGHVDGARERARVERRLVGEEEGAARLLARGQARARGPRRRRAPPPAARARELLGAAGEDARVVVVERDLERAERAVADRHARGRLDLAHERGVARERGAAERVERPGLERLHAGREDPPAALEASAPGIARSRTITRRPACASLSATEAPWIPAPTTTTSVRMAPKTTPSRPPRGSEETLSPGLALGRSESLAPGHLSDA